MYSEYPDVCNLKDIELSFAILTEIENLILLSNFMYMYVQWYFSIQTVSTCKCEKSYL